MFSRSRACTTDSTKQIATDTDPVCCAVLQVHNASNMVFIGIGLRSPVRNGSAYCESLPEYGNLLGNDLLCPALLIYRSYGIQFTQASVVGRIDVFRCAYTKLDSLFATAPWDFQYHPGVIRMGMSGIGVNLTSSQNIISNNDLFGAWELIYLYRGTIGATVRNNFLHDYLFSGFRCGADVHFAWDCALTTVKHNFVFSPQKKNLTGDSAGIYFCTHWFSPGNKVSCNYVVGGDHCYYLDYCTSGVEVEGGVCLQLWDGVKLNNGKRNHIRSLLMVGLGQSPGYITCFTVTVNHCRKDPGSYWEAMRKLYYDTPEINKVRVNHPDKALGPYGGVGAEPWVYGSSPPLSTPLKSYTSLCTPLHSSPLFSTTFPPFPTFSTPSTPIHPSSLLSTPLHSYPPLSTPIHPSPLLSTPLHSYPPLSTPIHPSPLLSTPLHSYPPLSTPIHPSPLLFTPLHSYPPLSTPIHPSPLLSTPLHSYPPLSTPIHPSPLLSTPSTPIHPSSLLSTPLHSYPPLSTPIHPSPLLSTPLHSYPPLSTPIHPSPLLSTPLHSYPPLSTPIHPSPLLSTPLHSYPLPPLLSTPLHSYPPLSTPIHPSPLLSTPLHSYPPLSTPIHPSPLLSTPLHSYPPLSTPIHPSPLLSTPLHSYPPLSTPIHPSPLLSTPLHSYPPLSTPIHPSPLLSTPLHSYPPLSTPIHPSPLLSTPLHSYPPLSTPIHPSPLLSTPLHSYPPLSTPIHPSPLLSTPLHSYPPLSTPIHPSPLLSTPLHSYPPLSTPIHPSPLLSTPLHSYPPLSTPIHPSPLLSTPLHSYPPLSTPIHPSPLLSTPLHSYPPLSTPIHPSPLSTPFLSSSPTPPSLHPSLFLSTTFHPFPTFFTPLHPLPCSPYQEWPWMKHVCRQTRIGAYSCNPPGPGALTAHDTGACSGMATENDVEYIVVDPDSLRDAEYRYCEKNPGADYLNRQIVYRYTGEDMKFADYANQDFGVSENSIVLAEHPGFVSCPKKDIGIKAVSTQSYFKDWNIPEPPFFQAMLDLPYKMVFNSELF
ncbi:unnamed protein product [Closterium sp. Yama58-4]|nr:unnamed protein product [Closterium sp. Yama58-4]